MLDFSFRHEADQTGSCHILSGSHYVELFYISAPEQRRVVSGVILHTQLSVSSVGLLFN